MALRIPAFNDAKTYGFEWLRAILESSALQEGVLNLAGAGTDCAVTPAGAGGLRVDIAAGAAVVKGDSGALSLGISQGLWLAINDAAVTALTLTTAHASLPRIDQIVLHVYDSSDLGSGADQAVFEVVTGTATSGATLDNRNGAAALPNDCLRLCDVLVPAAAGSTTSANMRDRRPWARGAYHKIVRTQNAAAGADYTTLSTPFVDIDATNLRPRVELSGTANVRITLRGGYAHNTASGLVILQPAIDGLVVESGMSDEFIGRPPVAALNSYNGFTFIWDFGLPNAGSHLLSWQWRTVTGTAVLTASTGQQLQLTVEEMIRQNARNNATSG